MLRPSILPAAQLTIGRPVCRHAEVMKKIIQTVAEGVRYVLLSF